MSVRAPLPADETTVADFAARYGYSVRTVQRAVVDAGVWPIGRGARAVLTSNDISKVKEALRRCPTRSPANPAPGTSLEPEKATPQSPGADSFPTASGPRSSRPRDINRRLRLTSGASSKIGTVIVLPPRVPQ